MRVDDLIRKLQEMPDAAADAVIEVHGFGYDITTVEYDPEMDVVILADWEPEDERIQ
jgi:hypothetical protein